MSGETDDDRRRRPERRQAPPRRALDRVGLLEDDVYELRQDVSLIKEGLGRSNTTIIADLSEVFPTRDDLDSRLAMYVPRSEHAANRDRGRDRFYQALLAICTIATVVGQFVHH